MNCDFLFTSFYSILVLLATPILLVKAAWQIVLDPGVKAADEQLDLLDRRLKVLLRNSSTTSRDATGLRCIV